MDIASYCDQVGQQAKQASRQLATLATVEKNRLLEAMAANLVAQQRKILTANEQDLIYAEQKNLSPALCDRLLLNKERIAAMAEGLTTLASLDEPIGNTLKEWQTADDITIHKVSAPIGVIGVIYESRPNVTSDVAGICLKSGNAVILRGGSEARHSNQAIVEVLNQTSQHYPLPPHAIQLLSTQDRSAVTYLLHCPQYIDLIIPRGGSQLIRAVAEQAQMPVLKHDKGICHVYVDASANLDWAVDICLNAKCQRPGVCNAMETLLIDKNIAANFLPQVVKALREQDVECRGDHEACQIVDDLIPATEEDWDTEYLAPILSIALVDNYHDAIYHINTHGSHHSDAIIANDTSIQQAFCHEVDSAVVYVNASTRFTDGGAFGMGAEIGISTDKLHARGPVSLKELTTYKYIVEGEGQTRPG